jgi:uncharacterized UBP type Zn finger protein
VLVLLSAAGQFRDLCSR